MREGGRHATQEVEDVTHLRIRVLFLEEAEVMICNDMNKRTIFEETCHAYIPVRQMLVWFGYTFGEASCSQLRTCSGAAPRIAGSEV